MSQIGDRPRPSQRGSNSRPGQQRSGGRSSGPNRRPPSGGGRGRDRGRSGGFPFRQVAIPAAVVVLVVVVIIVVVAVTGGGAKNKTGPDYQPAAAGVVSLVSGVPQSVFDAVKVPTSSATPPNLVTGTPLTLNGKPEILYMGEEWCPYCGAARWAMVTALSRFGTFSGLKTTMSSSNDVDPDTNTFSFVGATYSSPYISFVTDEMQDSNHNSLENPTAANQKLMTTYDPSGGVPFIDFGNKYVVGSTYDPALLQGLSWPDIASKLSDPTSPVTQGIVGSANFMTAIICKLTNGQPGSVCNTAGVQAGEAVVAQAKSGTSGSSTSGSSTSGSSSTGSSSSSG